MSGGGLNGGHDADGPPDALVSITNVTTSDSASGCDDKSLVNIFI